jgi:hypothetical protein
MTIKSAVLALDYIESPLKSRVGIERLDALKKPDFSGFFSIRMRLTRIQVR